MRSSSRRSSSLQRTSRAGSAKRGQRASTPSRRLSDLQERPVWDATSSNLDKFKLTAEEQERRKASRVSKNRPLASDTSRRSFVEAWAKHVTSGVLNSDTAHDQDRPRSSPPAGDLPINYSSVVDLLRKSPHPPGDARAATSAVTAATTPIQNDGQDPSPSRARRDPGFGVAASANRRGTNPSSAEGHQQSSSAASASAADGLTDEPSAAQLLSYGSAGAAGSNGSRPLPQWGLGSGKENQGRWDTAAATGQEGAAAGGVAAAGGGGGAAHHRGDVSVTPVELRPRYRFNPAEATTIIAFGDDSDEEPAEYDRASGSGAFKRSPGQQDSLTVAFEEALFGNAGAGAASGGAGSVAPQAWASNRGGAGGGASQLDAAAGDVERRLRALEGALYSGVAGGSSAVLQEDVAVLRLELRKVQQDNAKLRQELSTFSTHASALLTQLQAQVQQLLRVSGAGAPTTITAVVPTQTSSALHPLQQHPHIHQPPPSLAGEGLVDVCGPRGAAPQPHSHSHAQQPAPHMPLLRELLLQQPLARRNIFADIDPSVLRPLALGRAGAGSTEAAGAGGTPHTVYGGVGDRLGTDMAPTSPLIDAGGMAPPTYVQHPAPGGGANVDDAEVALPSFAAFRRSAGAAAFTSARPVTGGLHAPPSNTAGAGAAAAAALGREAAGNATISPAPAPGTLPARSFPTQYQPRSLGGVIVRPSGNAMPGGSTSLMGAAAAAATASAATATSGAYAAAAAANAATAAATVSDAAAVGLARAHTGLPQPLVFSVGPEFRAVRATGVSAGNSMSLSAHTAAAAVRSRASGVGPGTARGG